MSLFQIGRNFIWQSVTASCQDINKEMFDFLRCIYKVFIETGELSSYYCHSRINEEYYFW